LLAPRDWPLAPKLALALVGSALLPMGLAGAYNLGVGLDAVSAGELRAVEQIAHSTAGRVAQFVGDSRNLARAVAGDGAFAAYLARPDAAAAAALTAQLRGIVAANPEIQLLMLMDPSGLAVIANDAAVLGRNFSFREYFKSAVAGRPYASGITVGSVAGEPGIYYAEPVRGADGGVAGVLVLRMRGAVVARILAEVGRDSNLTPFMVDGDGVVVEHGDATRLYHSLMPLPPATARAIRADQRFGRDRIDSLGEAGLAQALRGARRAGHVSYRSVRDGSEQIAGYAPVAGRDWVVGVTEPRATFEAPLQRLYRELLVSVALVGLLFTGLALRLARGIVRPIRALTDAANALKAGDYERAGVQVASRDEVGQLGRTFNVMIDVLRQRERERGP
ncbi:MAG: HAMP domain-containing protein, partial [Burkholderiales bacterium]|nr:HAMP domain-containing protein [Burkholderiales bacterium]